MQLIGKAIFTYKKQWIKRKWKSMNSHNCTWLGEICNRQFIDFILNGGITVGKGTYGKLNINYTCNEDEQLIIGDYCSIATTCLFILGGEHDYRCITTFPFISRIGGRKTEVLTKGPIILDDEVWIGDNVTILSGIHVGKGAVIAAGSVVTHDVPPYGIVGGNPARLIKMRFDDDIISILINNRIDIGKVTDDIENALKEHLTKDNVTGIIQKLNK